MTPFLELLRGATWRRCYICNAEARARVLGAAHAVPPAGSDLERRLLRASGGRGHACQQPPTLPAGGEDEVSSSPAGPSRDPWGAMTYGGAP